MAQWSRTPEQVSVARNLFLVLVLINLCHPLDGIANLPIQFILKDHMQLRPTDIAAFNACVSFPLSAAWLAGFVRDSGRSSLIDQLYVTAGTLVGFACYLFLATSATNYTMLLMTTIAASMSFVLVKTTAQAVMVFVSKARALEDISSVVWNSAEAIPSVVSYILGAWLMLTFGTSGLFAICAGITVILFIVSHKLIGVENTMQFDEIGAPAGLRTTAARLAATLKEKPFILALTIIFLFTFSPGWQTPLLYYLTGTNNLSPSEFALFMSLVSGTTILGAISFGFCSQYASSKRLLWISTALLCAQSPIPLLITNPQTSYAVGAASGLMYGFGIASYWSLLIKTSPKGFEGTAYMLAVFISVVGVRGGDVLGSWMFEHGGFLLPMTATTLATIMIAPVLMLMSKPF